eukprot:366553-Chlamydomonas_euryale.AAC.21
MRLPPSSRGSTAAVEEPGTQSGRRGTRDSKRLSRDQGLQGAQCAHVHAKRQWERVAPERSARSRRARWMDGWMDVRLDGCRVEGLHLPLQNAP